MATRRDVEAVHPLSPLQHGMLFHAAHGEDVYFRLSEYEFRGPLDVARLEEAWQSVIARHAALRTAVSAGPPPAQVVFRKAVLRIPVHDLRSLAPADQESRLREAVADERAQGLALSRAPMMRLSAFRLDDARYRLLWAWHHILFDGWSATLALKEVGAFYVARASGRPLHLAPARPFGDFVTWLQHRDLDQARDFWRARLRGFQAPTPLPDAGWPAGETPTTGRGRVAHVDDEDLAARVRAFAQRSRVTPNMLIQATWAIVLGRHAGQDDVIFGATVAGRPADLDGADTIVGLFINTVPVRIRIDPDASIVSWLTRLQGEAAEAMAYEWAPLVDVQQASEMPHGRGLFDCLLVFENYPRDIFEQTYGANLPSPRVAADRFDCRLLPGSDDVHYALGVMVSMGRALRIEATFDRARLSPTAVDHLLEQFTTVLEGLLVDGARRVAEVALADRRGPAAASSPGQTPLPCVHDTFAARVADTPDAIAAACEGQQVSYREIWRRARMLSGHLAACGVSIEYVVALYLPRSPELLIAVLAVLRTGATYLPLEPGGPSERLRSMLDTARVAVIVTQEALRDQLPVHAALEVSLEDVWDAADAGADEIAPARVDPDNLAYVMYTSGSTGAPKGVGVTHRGLANLARAQITRFRTAAGTRVLQYASWTFDAAASEWTTTLLAGGCLVFAPRERLLPGRELADLLRQEQIEVVTLPPTALARLEDANVPSLKTVISAGEPCRGAWVARWAHGRRLLNAYGPTEATVCATMTDAIVRADAVGIGSPVDGVRVFIVDRGFAQEPIGVPGEIWIGGAGVARGYVHQPALTAAAFVPDAFSGEPGARLYRSGDAGRRRLDGGLDCLGRRDRQVKLRGYRIELEEIEAVLLLLPHIRQAAVMLRTDDVDSPQLVACIVADAMDEAIVQAWQRALRRRCPDYMIPTDFVRLDTLPLTPSGKVDRRALPRSLPSRPVTGVVGVLPRDNVEVHVLGLWQEILGRMDLDVDRHFFEVGGHSLHALALSERLARAYGRRLAVDLAFRYPTVRAMAAFLRREVGPTLPSTIVPLQTRGTRPPLFCVHPAGGLVHGYLDLSRHLGSDQPFYGIQAVGLDDEEPLRDLASMAARYVADAIAVQRDGPYFLAGWSLGAAIAYEMGRQLATAGRSVGLIALLDGGLASMDDDGVATPAATADASADAAREALTFLAMELGIPAAEWAALPDDRRIESYVRRAQEAGRVPADITVAAFTRLLRVIGHNVVARRRSRAQPYHGRVVLFRTAIREDRDPPYDVARLVSGSYEEREVPGDHTDMMREPHVAVLASLLRECMNDVLLSVGASS